jgi:hypothetical protein
VSDPSDRAPNQPAPLQPETKLDSTVRLRRGNAFQEIVQADFIANSKGGLVEREFHIDLSRPSDALDAGTHRTGRVDIWVDMIDDGACAVYEIKATDWDLITPGKVRRNIYRHQRQLREYAQTYVDRDNLIVTYGLIYPFPPESEGLRGEIEEIAMTMYSVPVYWYTELNPAFDRSVISEGDAVND